MTFTAITTTASEGAARGLGEALERVSPEPTGVGVFEIEDGSDRWETAAYFEEAPDATALAILAAAFGAADFAISELPETDWVAHVRRELSPVEAGRFFVYGSHDAGRVPEGRIALLIEAAMAFGTGHHGTTLGCLRALDSLADQGFRPANVADIGCGTAVLAMAAARLWPARVTASDIDPQAIEVARVNLAANDLTDRVHCVTAAGLDDPELSDRAPFDLILANILKGPLIDLAPQIAAGTAPGGRVVLSGLLTTQAEEVAAAYARERQQLLARDDIVDWSTLTLCNSDP